MNKQTLIRLIREEISKQLRDELSGEQPEGEKEGSKPLNPDEIKQEGWFKKLIGAEKEVDPKAFAMSYGGLSPDFKRELGAGLKAHRDKPVQGQARTGGTSVAGSGRGVRGKQLKGGSISLEEQPEQMKLGKDVAKSAQVVAQGVNEPGQQASGKQKPVTQMSPEEQEAKLNKMQFRLGVAQEAYIRKIVREVLAESAVESWDTLEEQPDSPFAQGVREFNTFSTEMGKVVQQLVTNSPQQPDQLFNQKEQIASKIATMLQSKAPQNLYWNGKLIPTTPEKLTQMVSHRVNQAIEAKKDEMPGQREKEDKARLKALAAKAKTAAGGTVQEAKLRALVKEALQQRRKRITKK